MTKFGLFVFLLTIIACKEKSVPTIPILIDTDANNELDDQHALAYAFFNPETFDIKGITVNATFGGGDAAQQMVEAERVMKLCNVNGKYPLIKGATLNFDTLSTLITQDSFDGSEAVDFIISEVMKMAEQNQKLILVPIGKLTNIALALMKKPKIKDHVRIVWLGSNYPDPGEYNLENDIPAMNYILSMDVPFEVVTVSYGKLTGSDFVKVTPSIIEEKMKGKGPVVAPLTGRNGGNFTSFGDYSINLFSHIDLYGDPPSRALFDLVALAVTKNGSWGQKRTVKSPMMADSIWVSNDKINREVIVWENFDRDAILEDFFKSVDEASKK